MRRAVVVVAGAVALALLPPWRVDAQDAVDVSVTEVGWWSSQPTAVAQPEGGFQIAAGATGEAQSVAALRLSMPAAKVDSLQVRLVESSSLGTELGVLQLCRTSDPWTAANPGAFDDAPEPDCTVSAGLTRTTDGVWLGDAAALAPEGGDVSVMIVPKYQPPAPIGPGMIVTISGGEFTGLGSPLAPTDTTSTFDPGTSPSFSGGESDPFGPVGAGSFGVPAFGGSADFGDVPIEVANPAPTGAATGGSDAAAHGADELALTPIDQESGPPPPWIRLVVLVPLSAAVGAGSVRARRLLALRAIPVG